MLVFNATGTVDEGSISSLGFIANLTKHIKVKSSSKGQSGPSAAEDSLDEWVSFMPSFLWILRDFSLNLVDDDGMPISADEYMESAIADQPGFDKETTSRNRIRKCVRTFFPDRRCFTLPRPVISEDDLHRLGKPDGPDLRPEFKEAMESLKNHILNNAKPKHLNGRPITGPLLVSLAKSYCDAINTGGIPSIADAWDAAADAECNRSAERVIDAVAVSLTPGISEAEAKEGVPGASLIPPLPVDEGVLHSYLAKLPNLATQMFESLAPKGAGSILDKHRQIVLEAITEKVNALLTDNKATSATFCAKLATELDENILQPGLDGLKKKVDTSKAEIRQISERLDKLESEFESYYMKGKGDASKGDGESALQEFFTECTSASRMLNERTQVTAHELQSQVQDFWKRICDSWETSAKGPASQKVFLTVTTMKHRDFEEQVAGFLDDLQLTRKQCVAKLIALTTMVGEHLSSKQSELYHALLESQNSLKDARTEVATLSATLESTNSRLDSTLQRLSDANKQVDELEADKSDLSRQLESSQSQVTNLNEQVATIRSKLDTSREETASLTSKVALLEEDIRKSNHKSKRLEDDRDRLQESKDALSKELETTRNELDETKNTLKATKEEFQSLLQKSEVSEKDSAHYKNLSDKLRAQFEEADKERAVLAADKARLEAELEKTIQSLTNSRVECDDLHVRVEELISEADILKATTAKESTKLLEQLKSEHNAYINELKADHDLALSSLSRDKDVLYTQLMVEKDDMESELTSQIESVTKQLEELTRELQEKDEAYAKEMEDLSRALADSKSSSTERETQLEDRAVRAEDSLKELEARMQEELEKLKIEHAAVISELTAQHEVELSSLREEHDELVKQLEAEKEDTVSKLLASKEKEFLDLKETTSQSLLVVEADKESKIRELARQRDEEVARLRKEAEEERERLAKEMKATKKEIEEERDCIIAELRASHEREVALLQQIKEEEVSALEREKESQIALVLSEKETEINELRSTKDEELRSLQLEKENTVSSVAEETADTIKRIVEEKDAEISAIRQEKDLEIENIEKSKNELIQRLEEEKATIKQALEESKQRELDALKSEKDDEIATLIAERDEAIEEIRREKEDLIFSLESENQAKADQIAAAKDEEIRALEAKIADFEQQITEKEMAIMEFHTKREHELARMSEEYKRELEAQLAEMNQQIAELEASKSAEIAAIVSSSSTERSEIEALLREKDDEIALIRSEAKEELEVLKADKDAEILRILEEKAQEIAQIVAEKDAEIERLTTDRDTTIAALEANHQTQIQELLQAKDAEIQRLQREMEAELEAIKADTQAELSRAKQDTGRLEALIAERDTLSIGLRQDKESAIALLTLEKDNEIVRIRQENEMAIAAVLEEKNSALAALTAQKHAEIEKRLSEREAVIRAMYEQKIASVMSSLSEKERELSTLTEDRELTIKELDEVNIEANELSNELDKAAARIAELENEIMRLNTQFSALHKDTGLIAAVQKEFSMESGLLENQVEFLRTANTDLQTSVDNLTSELDRSYEDTRKMKTFIQELEAQIAIHVADRAALASEHEKLQSESTAQIDQLNLAIASLQNSLREYEEKANETAPIPFTLTSRLEELEKSNDALKLSLQEEVKAKEDLSASLMKVQFDLSRYMEDNEYLKGMVAELQESLESGNRNCISIEEAAQNLSKETESLRLLAKEANEAEYKALNELEAMKETLASTMEELVAMRERAAEAVPPKPVASNTDAKFAQKVAEIASRGKMSKNSTEALKTINREYEKLIEELTRQISNITEEKDILLSQLDDAQEKINNMTKDLLETGKLAAAAIEERDNALGTADAANQERGSVLADQRMASLKIQELEEAKAAVEAELKDSHRIRIAMEKSLRLLTVELTEARLIITQLENIVSEKNREKSLILEISQKIHAQLEVIQKHAIRVHCEQASELTRYKSSLRAMNVASNRREFVDKVISTLRVGTSVCRYKLSGKHINEADRFLIVSTLAALNPTLSHGAETMLEESPETDVLAWARIGKKGISKAIRIADIKAVVIGTRSPVFQSYLEQNPDELIGLDQFTCFTVIVKGGAKLLGGSAPSKPLPETGAAFDFSVRNKEEAQYWVYGLRCLQLASMGRNKYVIPMVSVKLERAYMNLVKHAEQLDMHPMDLLDQHREDAEYELGTKRTKIRPVKKSPFKAIEEVFEKSVQQSRDLVQAIKVGKYYDKDIEKLRKPVDGKPGEYSRKLAEAAAEAANALATQDPSTFKSSIPMSPKLLDHNVQSSVREPAKAKQLSVDKAFIGSSSSRSKEERTPTPIVEKPSTFSRDEITSVHAVAGQKAASPPSVPASARNKNHLMSNASPTRETVLPVLPDALPVATARVRGQRPPAPKLAATTGSSSSDVAHDQKEALFQPRVTQSNDSSPATAANANPPRSTNPFGPTNENQHAPLEKKPSKSGNPFGSTLPVEDLSRPPPQQLARKASTNPFALEEVESPYHSEEEAPSPAYTTQHKPNNPFADSYVRNSRTESFSSQESEGSDHLSAMPSSSEAPVRSNPPNRSEDSFVTALSQQRMSNVGTDEYSTETFSPVKVHETAKEKSSLFAPRPAAQKSVSLDSDIDDGYSDASVSPQGKQPYKSGNPFGNPGTKQIMSQEDDYSDYEEDYSDHESHSPNADSPQPAKGSSADNDYENSPEERYPKSTNPFGTMKSSQQNKYSHDSDYSDDDGSDVSEPSVRESRTANPQEKRQRFFSSDGEESVYSRHNARNFSSRNNRAESETSSFYDNDMDDLITKLEDDQKYVKDHLPGDVNYNSDDGGVTQTKRVGLFSRKKQANSEEEYNEKLKREIALERQQKQAQALQVSRAAISGGLYGRRGPDSDEDDDFSPQPAARSTARDRRYESREESDGNDYSDYSDDPYDPPVERSAFQKKEKKSLFTSLRR